MRLSERKGQTGYSYAEREHLQRSQQRKNERMKSGWCWRNDGHPAQNNTRCKNEILCAARLK